MLWQTAHGPDQKIPTERDRQGPARALLCQARLCRVGFVSGLACGNG
jgi:trans-aconitate methyltransferase